MTVSSNINVSVIGNYDNESTNNKTYWDAMHDDGEHLEIMQAVEFYRFLYERLAPTLFTIITVVGLVGNGAVVCVIVCRHQMRSSTANLLLLNLACSDLCFLTLCVPFVAYHFAADSWRLGEVPCRLFQYVLYVCVYVTVYTLMSIAAFRFLIIVHHARLAARYATRRVITAIIAFIWVTVALANSPILSLYSVKTYTGGADIVDAATNDTVKVMEQQLESESYRYCAIVSVAAGQQLFISFFCMAYVVPLSVICVFYCLIVRYLKRRVFCNGAVSSSVTVVNGAESILRATASVVVLNNQHHTTLDNHQPELQTQLLGEQTLTTEKKQRTCTKRLTRHRGAVKSRERSARAIRLLLTLVAVFSASWAPLHGLLLAAYFGYQSTSPMYDVFRLAAHCLAYGNSCMNPIVYSYVSHEFRQNFRDLCCTSICRLYSSTSSGACRRGCGGSRPDASERRSSAAETVRPM
jgi:hypothetical protein